MKTAILVTARLKSVRLPLKVIKPIQGKPMLVHLLDRLKLARRAEGIIICTSPAAQDDPLVEIAASEGVECYRGDPVDVLRRLTDAATQYGLDTVVNCTADNPFVDPVCIDRLLGHHWAEGDDYTRTEGLPWGAFAYALRCSAMERACELKANEDTEVWGGYFTDAGHFHWSVLEFSDPDISWPELRLTVDTPEDFELITRIFDELYQPGDVFPLCDIVALCRRRPDLVAINADVMQKNALPIRVKEQGL